jgi:hypothetical protein
MTIGTIKTQGTELWFIDRFTTSDTDLLKLSCPTGIQGIGSGAKAQIPTTCLDNTEDETSVPGLGSPTPITVPFNFIPSAHSHQVLYDLKSSGDTVRWLAGLSDGTAAPTVNDDQEFVPPTSPNRTSVEWQGYVSEVSIDIATNEIVRGTLTIQRTGSETWHWNGPTPT